MGGKEGRGRGRTETVEERGEETLKGKRGRDSCRVMEGDLGKGRGLGFGEGKGS